MHDKLLSIFTGSVLAIIKCISFAHFLSIEAKVIEALAFGVLGGAAGAIGNWIIDYLKKALVNEYNRLKAKFTKNDTNSTKDNK